MARGVGRLQLEKFDEGARERGCDLETCCLRWHPTASKSRTEAGQVSEHADR